MCTGGPKLNIVGAYVQKLEVGTTCRLCPYQKLATYEGITSQLYDKHEERILAY